MNNVGALSALAAAIIQYCVADVLDVAAAEPLASDISSK